MLFVHVGNALCVTRAPYMRKMRPASKRRSGGAFSGVSIIVKRGVKLNCIIIFFIELNESGVNKVLFASLLPQFVFLC